MIVVIFPISIMGAPLNSLAYLISSLILIGSLNKHQLAEISLTACIINYNVNTPKACSKIFRMRKTKFGNKTVELVISLHMVNLEILKNQNSEIVANTSEAGT